MEKLKMVPAEKLSAEQIAKAMRVPYWLVDGSPRPSWRHRPIWRLRALLWR